MYDRLDSIDVEAAVRYVVSLQQDDGSFFGMIKTIQTTSCNSIFKSTCTDVPEVKALAEDLQLSDKSNTRKYCIDMCNSKTVRTFTSN